MHVRCAAEASLATGVGVGGGEGGVGVTYHQCFLSVKADLCSRSQLSDWDTNHPVHVLDAKASQRMGHHTEAIVGVTLLLTAALTTALTVAAAATGACICIMSARCILKHTVPYPPQKEAYLTVSSVLTGTRSSYQT